MKSLLVVLLLTFGWLSDLQAQALRVRLADNSRFNVSVNGRHFRKNGTSITVGDLPEGKQHLKIYSLAHDRWGRVYDKLIYQGSVITRFNTITYFVYDPYNRRIQIRNLDGNSYVADKPYQAGPGNKGNNVDTDNNYNGDDVGQNPANGDERGRSGAAAASPLPMGSLTVEDADKLKEKVAAKKTDTDKLKLIKSALKRETITTLQVSNMLDWFLFESTRVEFAKWAYDITVDKSFYTDIIPKFQYNSSKEELEQFLNTHK